MFKVRFGGVLALVALALTSGCATAIKGSTQEVHVDVTGPLGADCMVTNATGQWSLRAPGTVKVGRSNTALTIKCEESGYEPATRVLTAKFNAVTLGNLALGGVIGVAVDAASGANHSYPDAVLVEMTPACAAEDADCLASVAADRQRQAEELARAREQREGAEQVGTDPASPLAEEERTLVVEQGKFDAWYATHRDEVQDQLNDYVRRTGLVPECGLEKVYVFKASVSGLRSGGYLVDLRWGRLSSQWSQCVVQRNDSFFLRVENDELIEIDHLGSAKQSAFAG